MREFSFEEILKPISWAAPSVGLYMSGRFVEAVAEVVIAEHKQGIIRVFFRDSDLVFCHFNANLFEIPFFIRRGSNDGFGVIDSLATIGLLNSLDLAFQLF
jgi:hypothetical protein